MKEGTSKWETETLRIDILNTKNVGALLPHGGGKGDINVEMATRAPRLLGGRGV